MQLDPLQYFKDNPLLFPWLVFGCSILENDITFIMAGVYSSSVFPHENPLIAIVCGVLGALCHDSFWYAIARNRSEWLKKTSAWKRLGPQIESWAQRIGVRELFYARFLPGTRNASVLFWGVQRLPLAVFYTVEVIALSIWGSILVFTGYFLGSQAQSLLGRVKQKHLGRWLLLALLLTLIVYICVRAFTKHEIVKHGKPPADPRAD